ncbi:MAG: hypothetical protein CMO01_03100 [Thalassobius sp.]|nr:hypothetical protein [Thalassovita sp.]
MKMKLYLAAILMISIQTAFSQMPDQLFPYSKDIGQPKITGSSAYHPEDQSYTIDGAGYNIWFERDEFHYLYNTVEGDFIFTSNLAFEKEGSDPHMKIGLMLRASEEDNAAHVSAVLHGDGLTVMQWRKLKGAFMRDPQDEIFALKKNYDILQIERKGDEFIFRGAHKGEPLQVIGTQVLPDMPNKLYVGLFTCAHNPDEKVSGKFWNVRLDNPVASDYDPYESGFLGCRMETMNVFDGKRKVIFVKKDRFEAPNWMPDSKKLLFNMDGSMYKIPVDGGTPEKLNTGFADNNNNDHGISFDGKMLAISHHRSGLREGGSTVYVLPLEGGTPKLITEETPSYWHGWSADGKDVVFVAKRGETQSFNIYKASIKDSKETQLTFNDNSHVDGPEYSPDGKYIYYNGNQSGTMQVWRMKPDGSGKEQLTFDQYNNWFPHISPDGNWMVYLSFTEDIDVDAHPSYKRVELKLVPLIKGDVAGTARVIAYLYGGQGTINVPSWSPDSKHIAFVSNSRKY